MHYVVESFSVMSWGVHFLQRRRITARILPTCCAFERDVASCCWLVCSWNARLFSAWMFVGYVVIFTVLKRVVCIYVSVLPSVGMLFWCRIVNETRLEVASGCAYAEFVPCFCQAVSSCCIDSFVVLPCLCFSLLLNSLLYWHLMSQVLHMKLPGVRTSQKKENDGQRCIFLSWSCCNQSSSTQTSCEIRCLYKHRICETSLPVKKINLHKN